METEVAATDNHENVTSSCTTSGKNMHRQVRIVI